MTLGGVFCPPVAGAKRISVTAVRYWSLGEVTRVAVQTDGEFSYKFQRLSNPNRIYFDILNSTQRVSEETTYDIEVNDGLVKQIRVAQNKRSVTRIVLDLIGTPEVTSSQLANPNRLMIEVRGTPKIPRTSELRKLPEPEKAAAASPQRPPAESIESPPKIIEKPLSPPKESERASTATETAPETATPDKRTTSSVETSEAPQQQRAPESSKPQEVAKLEAPPEIKADPRPEEIKPAPKPPTDSSESAQPEPEAQAAAEDSPEEILVATPAKSNSSGGRSLTRVLGLKMTKIVLDPGHGGRDTGTIGPTGLREKDIVLDVAIRLKKLIEEGMGSEVVLTREGDTLPSLGARTSLANEHQADLFLSIHVNASRYKSVSGVGDILFELHPITS